MIPSDFVYKQTYSACIDEGCDESLAKETAKSTLLKYQRNEFNGKVSKLIKQSATNAKKLIVKKRKK